jgi:hypothetical protein
LYYNSTIIQFQPTSRRECQEETAIELLIQQGLYGLEDGEYTSVYSAAESLGILEAILRRRRKGKKP